MCNRNRIERSIVLTHQKDLALRKGIENTVLDIVLVPYELREERKKYGYSSMVERQRQ